MTLEPSGANRSADPRSSSRAYSYWSSLAESVAIAVAACGLLFALDLKTHIPALLLGIAVGHVLYEAVRLIVLHSVLGHSPVAREIAEAAGFRPTPIESDDPSTTRSRQ
jgi:hypothetical protein